MYRIFALILVLGLFAGCTTTKWTIVDEHAVNENQQPRVLSEKLILAPEQYPTVESPILRLVSMNIIEEEYDQRIKVERTVQEYRPKWGFSILTLSGAAFAITAANTSFLSDVNSTQRLALNVTSLALATLAVTNLRESGDPIYTGELQYLRRTGFVTKTDTTASLLPDENTFAKVEILFKGEQIFIDEELRFTGNTIELNMGAFADQLNGEFDPDSEIVVRTQLEGSDNLITIPAVSFLEPYFQISEDVVLVRSQPVINAQNVIAELGEGSSLQFLEDYSDRWVKVLYGNQEAYVALDSGFKEWRSEAGTGPPVLVEFADIPFGEIDVESALPVLKTNNPLDRALILSNISGNQSGSRQYAGRDVRLFEHYMKTSFRMQENQIINTIEETQSDNWFSLIEQCETEGGVLKVFINGFAKIENGNGTSDIKLFHLREDGTEHKMSLNEIMNVLTECGQEKTIVFIDLEYLETGENGLQRIRNLQTGAQQRVANTLINTITSSVVIFGNLPGQESSLYSGLAEDDKRHHIFPYFVAQALQQRKTNMNDLLRHLQNNVDYTSRRIHDRPQEINAFGNYTINLTD